MLVQEIQNTLIEDVRNKLSYFVELKWSNNNEDKAMGATEAVPTLDNNMSSIHIYTKKDKLFEKVLEVSNNYTNYFKKDYKIDKIIIKEIKNRNPHIKININK